MSLQSVSPVTGQVLAEFQEHSDEEVDERLERAARTFLSYRETSYEDRSRWMTAAAELLEGEQPALAETVTLEMGKTFAQAKGEVSKCAMAFRWFADNAERLLNEEKVETSAKASVVRFDPLGPVLAIMPWNFPFWQVVRFAAPSLMAGNVVVLKHASNVSLTALSLESVFARAGFPCGAFTTLLMNAGRVRNVIEDDRITAVTLTGSEAAGRSVGQAAGAALKKAVLELGGSDPFIVLASADLDRAVPVGVRARIQNNGQSCIAAKRFLIDESVFDEYYHRFTDEMAALVLGDPFDPATDVGPLSSRAQRDEVAGQVDDAVAKGATISCGGSLLDGAGWFYPPTVITGVTSSMRISREEVFGPVAVVEKVRGVEDAIREANRTVFGLGASVWTQDREEADRCVAGVEAGQVFVNAMVASTPELPFGGIKRSGYGRELSSFGLKEFCNAKSVWIA
ncbi:MAG: NAD-dependent succinate-semialdehyde dehydrogenase [Actinobacteria bacterium]|nr:NAD-dependent succinate-semialdehyde dehydrogenase [Actinomycetota bacterium]MCL5445324.1 NAD-dependent succinate-semialdehyde dehydrogenase [Actinomycetota bacterium]